MPQITLTTERQVAYLNEAAAGVYQPTWRIGATVYVGESLLQSLLACRTRKYINHHEPEILPLP